MDASPLALACERFGDGFLGQPANAVSSLAFVIAGLLVLLGRRGPAGPARPARPARPAGEYGRAGLVGRALVGVRWQYGLLVVAVGVGSLVQHGPHPSWQAYAHDLPLATLLAFVAADAADDLASRPGAGRWDIGRRLRRAGVGGSGYRRWSRWWPVVPVAMVALVAAGPVWSSAVQGLLAVVAIGLNLVRARVRPRLRRVLLPALALLALGALAGTLTDRTALCEPASLWQGHAAWHVLAATALWWLAPAIGTRGRPARPAIPATASATDTPP